MDGGAKVEKKRKAVQSKHWACYNNLCYECESNKYIESSKYWKLMGVMCCAFDDVFEKVEGVALCELITMIIHVYICVIYPCDDDIHMCLIEHWWNPCVGWSQHIIMIPNLRQKLEGRKKCNFIHPLYLYLISLWISSEISVGPFLSSPEKKL